MKYRVMFKCYAYNTGSGDNHYYINYEDFDTFEAADAFRKRIEMQFTISADYEKGRINFKRYHEWFDSYNAVKVENGFIVKEEPIIVKYYPEREEEI